MDIEGKLIIGMIGLPARGKSYISKKLVRMLNWAGFNSKVFNIGIYRRQLVGTDCGANFFNQENKEGRKLRENCALLAMEDLVKFLHGKKSIKIKKFKKVY